MLGKENDESEDEDDDDQGIVRAALAMDTSGVASSVVNAVEKFH